MDVGAGGAARDAWLRADVVRCAVMGASVTAVDLRLDTWPGHLPGQYVEVRDDPRRDVHRFSIANPHTPGQTEIQLVAASRLLRGVTAGSTLEVRGPAGAGLAWNDDATASSPLLLVAGGTGIVPLMAIARAWRRRPSRPRLKLLYSARSADDLVYPQELRDLGREDDGDVVTILTRHAENGRSRVGRLSALDLELYGIPPADAPECFVCGPASFVEDVARMLVQAKHPAISIHTEWDVIGGGES